MSPLGVDTSSIVSFDVEIESSSLLRSGPSELSGGQRQRVAIARALSRAICMKDGRIVAGGDAASVVAPMHASEMETVC